MELCTASNGRIPPGFRFHPSDVELFLHYLKRKLLGKKLEPELVVEVDIYRFHPSDLREVACLKKDMDWYFFCPRGKKYGSGDRTNRATQSGYWKGTGKDKAVSYRERTVGKVRTLVFHLGKPPKGERTDWVMHEYRLEQSELGDKGCSDAFVLCKVFKKGGWGPRTAEQYGAAYDEEEWDQIDSDVTDAEQAASGSGDGSVQGVDRVVTSTTDGSNGSSASMVGVVDESVDEMPYATIPKADGDIMASFEGPLANNGDDIWCADGFGMHDCLVDMGGPEQVGSGLGDGSVSGVDQPQTTTSDGFSAALTSKGDADADIALGFQEPIVDDAWCAADFGIYDSFEDVGKLEDMSMDMGLDELILNYFDFDS